jgi:uncharacterized ferritin-like protein (DUF455 family)
MSSLSISSAIREALLSADPRAKIMTTRAVRRDWLAGRLTHSFETPMPKRPGRPSQPALVAPNQMPKRGRGQSLTNRIAFLHALAHIEFNAIDLALDIVGRFGAGQPRQFVDDWLKVAAEEAMHFALLDRRLKTLGSGYGALPAHDGLWEASEITAHDLKARLAVVPLVLEARGLDVSPTTIERFAAAGDRRSAQIMARIYADEIGHVRTGFRWFSACCDSASESLESQWQSLVRTYFRGPLKSPFNDSARESAGLTRNFYTSLASAVRPHQ